MMTAGRRCYACGEYIIKNTTHANATNTTELNNDKNTTQSRLGTLEMEMEGILQDDDDDDQKSLRSAKGRSHHPDCTPIKKKNGQKWKETVNCPESMTIILLKHFLKIYQKILVFCFTDGYCSAQVVNFTEIYPNGTQISKTAINRDCVYKAKMAKGCVDTTKKTNIQFEERKVYGSKIKLSNVTSKQCQCEKNLCNGLYGGINETKEESGAVAGGESLTRNGTSWFSIFLVVVMNIVYKYW
jgi:hypothetical protein